MIRVLIGDDHPIVRVGLEKILSEDADIVVTGSADNAHEVMKLLENGKCDVLVLDIMLPDISGLEILERLKQRRQKPPILILSLHKEGIYALRAFKMGASGYLTKESTSTELISAIRKIAAGGKYVSPLLADFVVDSLGREANQQARHEKLSFRELQVMKMIASGLAPRSIADKLCLSVKTINAYRTRILEKMGFTCNAQLVRYAVENKLIE